VEEIPALPQRRFFIGEVMNELVAVSKRIIGEEEVNAVDARDLHKFLEVETRFNDWINRRINTYGFVKNTDFYSFSGKSTGGRPNEEYSITIDMAKELSMVERNDKGKQARTYFIECEKRLKKQNSINGLLPEEIGTRSLKASIEMANIFGITGNPALLSANIAVKNLHGIDCMATLGITGLIEETKTQYHTPTILGKQNGLSATKMNKAMEAAGLQTHDRDHKNRIVWKVTEKGKAYCQVIDTNKKHSDGSPVQQIKWSEKVFKVIE
jgi:phage anti-repressor protein